MSHLRMLPDLPADEPTDEDIWLSAIARQVETHARPLFAATWLWLFEQALELDDDQAG